MRNWTPDDVRATGRDPDTGRIVKLPDRKKPSENPAKPLSASARSYLKPEQLLQVECIEAMRPRLLGGAKLIPLNGELPGGSKLFRLWQAVRAAMGYQPGTPDLMILARSGRSYFIELKRAAGDPDLLGHKKARGELAPEQREWRAWAQEHGIPWAVCRTVPEVENALIGWGLILAENAR